MAVISLVNAKGGSGKTTTSFVLADRFSALGYNTCLVDTDPNGAIQKWREGRGESLGSAPFDVIHVIEEREIVAALQKASEFYDLVIVDTEGTAHVSVTRVLSRTHLAILPLNGSFLDAQQAARVADLVVSEAEMLRTHIEYRLMFSRLSAAVQSNTSRDLREQMQEHNLPLMNSFLTERRAYRDVFQFNRTLGELVEASQNDETVSSELGRKTDERKFRTQKEGYIKSIENADKIANEVIELLKEMEAAGEVLE